LEPQIKSVRNEGKLDPYETRKPRNVWNPESNRYGNEGKLDPYETRKPRNVWNPESNRYGNAHQADWVLCVELRLAHLLDRLEWLLKQGELGPRPPVTRADRAAGQRGGT